MLVDHRAFRLMLQSVEPNHPALMAERCHPNGNGLLAEDVLDLLASYTLGRIQKQARCCIRAKDVTGFGCHQQRNRQDLDERADLSLDHSKQLLTLIRRSDALTTTSGPLHRASIRAPTCHQC